jgi:hypothetical protein
LPPLERKSLLPLLELELRVDPPLELWLLPELKLWPPPEPKL